jgi:peptide/nickel transport system substrate-binding protein
VTEFRLLGPVEVVHDGRPLPLRGPKQRGLLALLLLGGGKPVSRDRLIEGLWGEAPPPRIDHALDAQVSSLRRTLAPTGGDRLVRRAPGYALRVEPGELDLERFEQRYAAGDPAEALALWRGPALADVLSEPFAAAAVRDLNDRRLAALEDRIESDLARGLGPELVIELERLAGEEPFRERLLGALAVALYRAGRQTAALEALAAARRRFAEQLGLDPGPALRSLERRILEHDRSLGPTRPRAARRHRRWVARVVVIAAAVGIAGVALGGSDHRPPTRLAGAQIVAFDATSGRMIRAAPLAFGPAVVVADGPQVWVTDSDEGVVARVDPRSGETTTRIAIPGAGAIAAGDGAVWVAGALAVSRIDLATARVTQTIPMQGRPSAVAFGAGRVWVADEAGQTLTRLMPATGQRERTVALDDRPTALAVADGLVWVASNTADSVTALDPGTMAPVATVGVGGGPVALAAGGGSMWVANGLDGTISRIDAQHPRVTATIPVAGGAGALAFAGTSVWVAGASAIARVDARSGDIMSTTPIKARPTSLTRAADAIVLASEAIEERRGGTLRLLATQPPPTVDPAHQILMQPAQFLGLVHDGLVTFNHVSGPQGLRLVPDLADGLPSTGAASTTFRFRLRPGIRYSTGAPVRAGDFRRALERIFRTDSPAIDYYRGIDGAGACGPRRCDLGRGVVTDDEARTVIFRLRAPDPDFLSKLAALNYASPVPPGTPLRDAGYEPIPGTGPYRIASADRREVRFVRNPYFHEWSRAAQPAGRPDAVVWRFGLDRAAMVRAVRTGRADATFQGVPAGLATEIANRHAGQLHLIDIPQTDFLQLNPRGMPFRDVRVRHAFNLAVDRREVVQLYGGPRRARPTCQVLPRGVRARQAYCPYPHDERQARRLVAAAGSAGAHVVIWQFTDVPLADGVVRDAARVLTRIGFRVTIRSGSHRNYARLPRRKLAAIDVVPASWYADYPSPSSFFDTFLSCRSATAGGFWCDPALDRLVRRADALEPTDLARADAAWARADRRAVDRAAWVPLVNPRELDFVSERLRDYRYDPPLGFLAAQASVVTGR